MAVSKARTATEVEARARAARRRPDADGRADEGACLEAFLAAAARACDGLGERGDRAGAKATLARAYADVMRWRACLLYTSDAADE